MVKAVRGVLIDLSGTLHVGGEAIPGAVNALKKLLSSNLAVRFVTNTTLKGTKTLMDEIQAAGFNSIKQEQVFSTPSAAISFLRERKLRPMLLVSPELMVDFQELETAEPNCVVVGLAPAEFHYSRLNEAFRLLLAGAPLLALHKGRYYKTREGLSLGPGAFVAGLEFAAGVTAVVVGKPSSSFFGAALESIGCAPDETVMIGDDLMDDVKGAQDAGICGILVRTGKYIAGDEDGAGGVRPDETFDSFVEAVDWLLRPQEA